MNRFDKNPWLIVPAFALASLNAQADNVILDDQIVNGSLCVGVDCSNGENFGADTIILKENNLRIKFNDTSNTGSFPYNDWQLTANDQANGGDNYFAIEDITWAKVPFRVDAGARTNALRVTNRGLGIGTSNPVMDLHATYGNTPTLRLEQNISGGFAAQTWDVGGNESNFFVRDATNNNKIPFKIKVGAPNDSLHIAANGYVGLGTSSPDLPFEVEGISTPKPYVAGFSDGSNPSTKVSTERPSSLLAVGELRSAAHLVSNTFPALWVDSQSNEAAVVINLDSDGAGAGIEMNQNSAGEALRISMSDDATYVMDVAVEDLVNSPALTNRFSLTYKAGKKPRTRIWEQEFRPDGYEFRADDNVLYTLDNAGNLILAGTLDQGSSRAIKHHIQAVNPQEVLAKVMGLEMNRWVYRSDKSNTEHLGPMAEDFHAAFGLGKDNKHIAITDVAGVALASTQALQNQLSAQDQKVKALQEENAALKARLERLEKAILAAE